MAHRDEDLQFGRELLLSGPKRNAVLQLWEVERYGLDSYGDSGYVSIYGLRPGEWYAKGVRLLGRTTVECTRDDLASLIAADITSAVRGARWRDPALVIDPFAGSGNTLYWILRGLPRARGIGFEVDEAVHELTRRNLSTMGLPIEVLHVDFGSGLDSLTVRSDQLLVVFVAPPWGDALQPATGLDLRRTTPPVGVIVDLLIERFDNPLLFAIQVHEQTDLGSMVDLRQRFDWSSSRIYDLTTPGTNHGIVLASKRWAPSTE